MTSRKGRLEEMDEYKEMNIKKHTLTHKTMNTPQNYSTQYQFIITIIVTVI